MGGGERGRGGGGRVSECQPHTKHTTHEHTTLQTTQHTTLHTTHYTLHTPPHYTLHWTLHTTTQLHRLTVPSSQSRLHTRSEEV